LVLSPSVIAFNINKSRSEVNRRLSELVDHGFVERVKRGYYEITETGEQYLAGESDPDNS
jgi:predicted transcriptional regulator